MCNPYDFHNSSTNTDGILFSSNEHTADKLFCELFCSKGIHSNVFVKNVQDTISSVHYKLQHQFVHMQAKVHLDVTLYITDLQFWVSTFQTKGTGHCGGLACKVCSQDFLFLLYMSLLLIVDDGLGCIWQQLKKKTPVRKVTSRQEDGGKFSLASGSCTLFTFMRVRSFVTIYAFRAISVMLEYVQCYHYFDVMLICIVKFQLAVTAGL